MAEKLTIYERDTVEALKFLKETPVFKEPSQEAETLSKINPPITIIAVPGVGKDTLSRKIHLKSTKAKAPVIEIGLPKEKRNQTTPAHNERRQRDHIECELF